MKNKDSLLWWLVGVVAMMIVAYVSESFWHGRFDFTQGKQYTLTPVTREIVGRIDDQVSVRAVFSENLPSQFAQLKTHIQDLLVEFEEASGGKISVRFEDPGQDSTKRMQVVREGIREIQVTEQARGEAVAKRGFFGMVITYGDKSEVVPLIENLETFEYDMVVRIKKLTGGRKKIGVIEGTGDNRLIFADPTAGPQSPPRQGFMEVYPSLANELNVLYDVTVVDANQPIAEDISMVLVSAPRNLNEAERYHLDQFLLRGRNALFLAPAVQMDFFRGLQAMPFAPDYLAQLAKYGFKIEPNMVLDSRHGTAFFGGGDLFGTPYPFFPIVSEEGLNRDNVVTAKIGSLMLPWTQSITMDSAGMVALMQSSPKAWVTKPPFDLMPQQKYMATTMDTLNLGVLRTDTLRSAFDSVPQGVDAQGRPHLQVGTGESSVLVIANSLFATDFFVRWSSQGMMGQNTSENISLLLNACDYLAMDASLITIRSREVVRRPISEEGYKDRTFWILFNLTAAPILLTLVGLFYILRRRARSRQFGRTV